MRLDPIIARRFSELAAKANTVLAQKQFSFANDEGVRSFSIPSPPFTEWATNVQNLLLRTFGSSSVHYQNFCAQYEKFAGYESDFMNCNAVFVAAWEDYQGGYLFNVRSLAKAEVLSDALAQAKELLQANYKDPACILARVALEATLKDLAGKNEVGVAKLDRMNADLCKAGVYNMAKQKQITAWVDIGNKAAHGEWKDYTEADAKSMVEGVEALVADLL